MNEGALRVRKLVEAARQLADPASALGRETRERLARSCDLSAQGIELALRECLEHEAGAEEIAALAASVPPALRAHVILARTVFTAPLRAIALALAQTPDVFVRPSRHEPELTALLAKASDGSFRVVDEIAADPGDHVWVYGGQDTLDELSRSLPERTVLHAHGPGFGVAVVDATTDLERAANALANDIVPFDQRGCLSPRLALVVGSAQQSRRFASQLARALTDAEARVPLGKLASNEAASLTRYRDTVAFAGETWRAGRGVVGLSDSALIAPVGRNLHVVACDDLAPLLAPHAASIAAIGIQALPALEEEARRALPLARVSPLGQMQRPRFDGAVDLRAPSFGTPIGR
jgi:acyl-CoA reductase-like NAD-dependent aldehyde dehydrogenase